MNSARSLSERLAPRSATARASAARAVASSMFPASSARPISARSRMARNSSRSLAVNGRTPVSASVYEPDAIGQRRAETVNTKGPAVSAATTICLRP